MKQAVLIFIAAIFSIIIASATHAQAENAEWQSLNKEATDLYRSGNYDQALVVANKALEFAEQYFGPAHPDVATSLNMAFPRFPGRFA